jgi:hypothetical protein
MTDLVEKLRKYLSQNTDEQIRKDWEKSKEFDEIKPTVYDFLNSTNIICKEKMLGNYACVIQCEKCKTNNYNL